MGGDLVLGLTTPMLAEYRAGLMVHQEADREDRLSSSTVSLRWVHGRGPATEDWGASSLARLWAVFIAFITGSRTDHYIRTLPDGGEYSASTGQSAENPFLLRSCA